MELFWKGGEGLANSATSLEEPLRASLWVLALSLSLSFDDDDVLGGLEDILWDGRAFWVLIAVLMLKVERFCLLWWLRGGLDAVRAG